MTVQAQSRIAALHEILRAAAQDGFAGLERGSVGSRMRVAADQVIAVMGDGALHAGLVAWRAELADFEGLELDTQAVVVARGLRLCFVLASARTARSGGDERGERDAPAQSLPGIGPALAERLAERGLHTVEDLVWFVPRRYDDARHVESLAAAVATAESGEVRAIQGEVSASRFSRRGRRRWVEVRLVDSPLESESQSGPGAGSALRGQASPVQVVVRWFHANPGMASRFPRG